MSEELILRIIELRRRLNRAVRDHTLDSWMKLNLTIPQLKSMFYVSRHGKINISTLASGLSVTPANVTGIVDRLVEQGLMTRTSDHADRRVLWLQTTNKGKALVDELREGRANEMRKILDELTAEELSIVAHGFDLLVKAAGIGLRLQQKGMSHPIVNSSIPE
jgi:DNA-binding MarR family transcriptional regulator